MTTPTSALRRAYNLRVRADRFPDPQGERAVGYRRLAYRLRRVAQGLTAVDPEVADRLWPEPENMDSLDDYGLAYPTWDDSTQMNLNTSGSIGFSVSS